MGQSDVGIRISADAAQARATFSQLGDAVKHLNEELAKAQEAGDYKAQANILMGINNTSQARAQELMMSNNAAAQQNQATLMRMQLGQHAARSVVDGMIRSSDIGMAGKMAIAGGDPLGGYIQMQKG
ncbi:MAG: hypothetical protein LBT33_08215, partial [Spirochaetia bacterium]|nr:hypothetical protein [Spirochaetia bacterium]